MRSTLLFLYKKKYVTLKYESCIYYRISYRIKSPSGEREDKQMYQMDARVRYSEVDETHRIKLESVLDYFQDCCTFHSEDVGGGLEFLKGQKRAWLLASWQIVIKEYPKLGEQIRIIANPYAFKNFFGHRNLMLQDEHGKDLVYANSNWIFVNTETGKPVRIPDEVANAYELGEPYPMEYAARKIPMPKHLEAKEPFAVHRFCIDSNHHVNNGKYVLMAEEFLPEQFLVSELRVEYRKAAVLGDIMYPFVENTEEKIAVVLADKEKSPYAIIEFFGGRND